MPPGQFSNFDLDDEEDFEQPVGHRDRPKKKTRRTCAFLDAEAGVDGDASADESDRDDASDCDGFIVGDDVFD